MKDMCLGMGSNSQHMDWSQITACLWDNSFPPMRWSLPFQCVFILDTTKVSNTRTPWRSFFLFCQLNKSKKTPLLTTSTVFRRVLYTVFFLQLQCKPFNAYNITDHLPFCCCWNPGRKNLSHENIWQKQNQSTLPESLEENIFRLFPVELSVFTNSFDKKSRKKQLRRRKK